MGFTDKQQALILALAAFFMALGTATATIPAVVPEDVRVPLSIFFWICGVVGFALKELGGWKEST